MTSNNRLFLRHVEIDVITSGVVTSFKGFRVSFKIVKTATSEPNRAEIEIYDLKKESSAKFETLGARIMIKAGYAGTYATVFVGDIVDTAKKEKKRKKKKENGKAGTEVTQTRFDGLDIITHIEASDGHNRYRNARLNRGFPAGVSKRDVIMACADAMGYPTNIDSSVLPTEKYGSSVALEGYARKSLDDLCNSSDLAWSIQNETLQVYPKGLSVRDDVVLLNPKTGLVGSPTKKKEGIEFESLLQPSLIPGRRVKLESRNITGIFTIQRVEVEGDSMRDDFLSRCIATSPKKSSGSTQRMFQNIQ